MSIPVVLTCPLGSKCEEVKDGAIHRCAWYMAVKGKNPNTGEDINEWGCSMAWMPVLMMENSRQQQSTSSAVESFRNEMVKSNTSSQQLLLAMATANPQQAKLINSE